MSKKALCVGINDYPGTGSDLSGCVNDAKDWKAALEERNYTVTSLLDQDATKSNISEALTTLIGGARAGDSLVFTFSGHGSWLPDDDGDEADGRDEMLCPHDIMENRYLLDDELAGIFSLKPADTNLYFISDSCHSGTVAKFAPALFPDAAARHPRLRLLPPGVFIKDPKELSRIKRVALLGRSSRQKYPALLAAGCRDVEFSYDANFNGRPNGAFTRVALTALKKQPKTPRQWMAEIRTQLPTDSYPQTPQLYGSRKAKGGSMF